MESQREFIDEMEDYFIQKFDLDRDFQPQRDQERGSRMQKGFQKKIRGLKDGRAVLAPEVMERKYQSKMPTITWTLIIDNSGSCSGVIIEQEKRLAVALIEVAKRLDIPLEILTFGGGKGYVFLKTFGQEVMGEDLPKIVLLNADQGAPDVPILQAACRSMVEYAE